MKGKLYINALGISSPLGDDPGVITKRLLAGDNSALQPSSALISGRKTYLGRVTSQLPNVPEKLAHYNCRNNQLLMHSYKQIAATVEHYKKQFGHARIGVIIGSSTAGIAEGEQALATQALTGSMPTNYHYVQQELGSVAEFVACLADTHGPTYTVSTACSSSGKVFASASRLLEAGLCDAVIVGGADSLCDLTVNGFDALESVSPARCMPFSKNRQGINVGEGSALFVISYDESELAVLGIGESSDAHHISAPDPTGRGAETAITAALSAAGLIADDIGYINLHGTGTPKNDLMESQVVERIFGRNLPCSSTKALVGHTLGAAGALELAFCCLLLSDDNKAGKLPPHLWDGVHDPELPEIHLATSQDTLAHPICMSNNFAFGGSNISLIVGKVRN